MAVLAHAVAAGRALEVLLVAIIDQRIEAVLRLDPDIAALAAIAAIGPAERNEFLPPERNRPSPAIAGADDDLGLVEEFHGPVYMAAGVKAGNRSRFVGARTFVDEPGRVIEGVRAQRWGCRAVKTERINAGRRAMPVFADGQRPLECLRQTVTFCSLGADEKAIMDTLGGPHVKVDREFGEFVINSFTPETIPMARLAEYMGVLAELLGKRDSLHFERVEPGSLRIKYWTPKEDAEEVVERPAQIAAGTADKTTLSAFNKMNDLLEADRAVGSFQFSAVVLPFPGRERVHSPIYGPVDEDMTIEGQLVRIGGKDRSIHAHIQDGDAFFNCEMTRGLAMDMCHYLFGPTIRVTGSARFQRDREGEWKQLSFKAIKFEELDDTPLSHVIAKWRAIEGNGWREIRDPLAELARLSSED